MRDLEVIQTSYENPSEGLSLNHHGPRLQVHTNSYETDQSLFFPIYEYCQTGSLPSQRHASREKGTKETAEYVFREAKKSRLQSELNPQPLKGEQQKAQPGRVSGQTYEKPNEGIFLRLNTRTKPIGRTWSG